MKTIAVDFDGVIHAYSAGWHDGTCYDIPVPGAMTALTRLMKTHAVFILSTRSPAQIQEWFGRMADNKLAPRFKTEIIGDGVVFWNGGGVGNGGGAEPVLGITNRKLAAIAYIDDRGIRFTNWADITNYFA